MRTITFTAEDRRDLAHDRYHPPDPRVQRKMEVLWLKSHGLGHDDIAAFADVSRRTVQRYLDEYREGGLPRLRRCRWAQPQGALRGRPPLRLSAVPGVLVVRGPAVRAGGLGPQASQRPGGAGR